MRKAFIISISIHVGLLLFLYYFGWERVVTISMPQVYQVQLISMPEVQAAPIEEPVPEVDVETIPPKPEEKKRLKPKQKEAKPKPQEQKPNTDKRLIQQNRTEGLSGMRSDEAFEFPWYLNLMINRIQRNWRNPYMGEADSVLCTVYFRVQRGGQITDSKVEKSSGEPSFDRAALRAVINSNPLTPLPPDFTESRLTIHLDFVYRR